MGAAFFRGAPTDAVTAMVVAVITTWAVTVGQLFVLNRRLKHKVPAGAKRYEVKTWFATSLPIFVAEGFYLLLTYVDILALETFALARRGGGLLCRRSAAGGRRFRLFRHRRRHDAQVHRISRGRRQSTPRLVLCRDHQVNVLAVARRLCADPRFRPAAARIVWRRLRARL